MTENPYLVGLRLAGKKVVVVGGGTVAQRRLPLLIASGADVHVISRSATPAVEAMNGITLSLREYRDGDLDGAWYAIAATDDPAVNAAVVAEADRRRIFCVRADVAVEGTRGHPGVVQLRRVVGRRAGRRRTPPVGGDPLGHPRGAATRPDQRRELRRRMPGGVALIGGGPGDPELITVRGRRLLAQADVVVADRLAPPELLAELPPHVEVIDAAKIPYGRAMAQDAINEVLIERARAGKFVVRLKGGDPFVFARGYEEVLACTEAGIPVTVVPGVTSAIGVPALAGVPVTHRAINHEFVVVSGHIAPDHPESLVNWNALAAMTGTHRSADGRRADRTFRRSAAGRRPTCGYAGAGGATRIDCRSADIAGDACRRAGEDPRRGHSTSRDHRHRGGRGFRRLKGFLKITVRYQL